VADKEKHDNVPWTLLITLIAVLITFFVVMPVMGFMYMDMYHATNAAVREVQKMKELRLQILTEKRKQRDEPDAGPAETADPR
jgi:type III secretory pathway component EscR